jgi:hypothetical protein
MKTYGQECNWVSPFEVIVIVMVVMSDGGDV